jgi:thymidylate synthase (FAD)
MAKPFPFVISPAQKERLSVYLAGRLPGESENDFAARVNKVLTKNDRDLIVKISDYYQTETMTAMKKIVLLDHGFVRLVDSMGSDLSVARAARVSYDAAWRAGEDEHGDERLIKYLWRNHHTTPFEAVTFTFEVHAPIFVFRQWQRHRTWSFNELSARYRPLPEVYYLPEEDKIGQQSAGNKQGREDNTNHQDRVEDLIRVDAHCKRAFYEYGRLLEAGWPRELARMVLPLNTYSHMFTTVNLLNLMKFFTLRSDGHAQYEIRVYSDAMIDLARKIAPVCIKVWEDNR